MHKPLAVVCDGGRITFTLPKPMFKPMHGCAEVRDNCGEVCTRFPVIGWKDCEVMVQMGPVAQYAPSGVYDIVLVDAACRDCAVMRLDLTKSPVGVGAYYQQPAPHPAKPALPNTLASKVKAAFAPWACYKGVLCASVSKGATMLTFQPEPPQGVLPVGIDLVLSDGHCVASVTVISVNGGTVTLDKPLDVDTVLAAGAEACFVWSPDNVANVIDHGDPDDDG